MMGHRIMTRKTPPKKEMIPRNRSRLLKNRAVLDIPIVSVNPTRNKISPKANKAESKKKMTPKNKKTQPCSEQVSETCKRMKLWHTHDKNERHFSFRTRNNRAVPIFVLSLNMAIVGVYKARDGSVALEERETNSSNVQQPTFCLEADRKRYSKLYRCDKLGEDERSVFSLVRKQCNCMTTKHTTTWACSSSHHLSLQPERRPYRPCLSPCLVKT